MACRYSVMEIVGDRLDEEAIYKAVRRPLAAQDAPLACCSHAHPSIKEAAQCREFGEGVDQAFQIAA